MKSNLHNVDRIIRVIIAIVVSVLFFTHVITGVLGIVLMILGGIFLITGFISFCPLYYLFGISTCKK